MARIATAVPRSETAESAGVRAVERAMGLLFRLAEAPGGASLQELAREVGCSKSTVHRLLGTLERMAVVERNGVSRQYRLGRRLRELSRESWAQPDLRQVALPIMRELRDQTEETVTLHLADDDAHVVVEQVESPHEIRQIHPIGRRIPLLMGATAKAILAFLPNEQAERLLARTRTPGGQGPSEQELNDIRGLGYAFSVAERVAGASAISAPILDHTGQVCAALSVSGPSFRFTPARATRCAPLLVQAVRRISATLGHQPSSLNPER